MFVEYHMVSMRQVGFLTIISDVVNFQKRVVLDTVIGVSGANLVPWVLEEVCH